MAAVPFVELYLLLLIGSRVGFWPTVMGIVGSAVLGAAVARREGWRVLRHFQQTLATGGVPEEGLLSAVLVFAGGLLLVFPGVLTDVAGILLLVPPTRRFIAERIRRRVSTSTSFSFHTVPAASVHATPSEPAPSQTHASEPSESSWRRVPTRRDRTGLSDAEIVEE